MYEPLQFVAVSFLCARKNEIILGVMFCILIYKIYHFCKIKFFSFVLHEIKKHTIKS